VILPDRTGGRHRDHRRAPATAQVQPFVEVRFRGTVAVVNCGSGLVEFIDDVTGRSRLRLGPTTALLDEALRPIRCAALDPGDRLDGKGIAKARQPDVIQVDRAILRAPSQP